MSGGRAGRRGAVGVAVAMNSSLPRLVVIAAALATTALSARARAETRPLRIHYQAHTGCPAAEVLVEEITWRTPLARLAAPGEDALDVRARITKQGAVSRGQLTLGTGRETITREIQGTSCDEVVSALALVTALAVDPRASTARKPSAPAPLPPPTPPPAPPPPAPIALPPRPLLPTSLPAPAPPELLAPPLPVQPAPPSPPPPASPPWSLGGRAVASFAATPGPLFGGAVFAERALSSRWGASLRLSAEVAATGVRTVGPGLAAFLRAAGRVEGCVFAWRPAAWLSLRPCLGVEGGVLRGEGLTGGLITAAAAATVPWFALDVLPRLGVEIGRGFVEVQGGPAFPLVRRRFVFEKPDFVVFELPSVTATVSVGAGFHFP